MVLSRRSATPIVSILAVCSAEVLVRQEGAIHKYGARSRQSEESVQVEIESHGQTSWTNPADQTSNRPDRTHDAKFGVCRSDADCKDIQELYLGLQADKCDVNGALGCANRCVSPPDAQSGEVTCMMKVVGEQCTQDYECVGGRCDTDDSYGCKNLCLSWQDATGHHCKTKPMGEPCSNHKQCLSGVCDTDGSWGTPQGGLVGCKGLCVSELDKLGFNRHCNAKSPAETCVSDSNCEGPVDALTGGMLPGVCDTEGLFEESGRCRGRCMTKSTPGCKRQHCSPKCPVCLSNLTGGPEGTNLNEWNGFPAHRVKRNQTSDGIHWHVSLKGQEETELRLRIPSSCVEDEACVEVKGNLEVMKLTGAKIYIQNGLYTGFPGPKPEVDVLLNSVKSDNGVCPVRADDFPESGHTQCCYNPASVANCKTSPYSKGCEQFLAGSFLFEWHWDYESWGYENRMAEHHDSFDQSTIQTRLGREDHSDMEGNHSASREFTVEIDFSAEKYKFFQIDGRSWYMDEPIMKFSKDRNCNHIHQWPEASFEFSLRLAPLDGANGHHDAEVKLTHLEINRKRSCRKE